MSRGRSPAKRRKPLTGCGGCAMKRCAPRAWPATWPRRGATLDPGAAQRAGPGAPRRQRRRGIGCGGSRPSSRQCPQPCPRCGAGLACPASLNTSLAGVAVCGGHPEKLAPLYKGQFRYNWYLASASASRNTLHAKPKRHARAGARARRRSGRRLVSDTRPGGAACERTFFGAVLRT